MPSVNIYADESRTQGHRYMLIGGLWLRPEAEAPLRSKIEQWRGEYWKGEMKFKKISKSSLKRYVQFARMFFSGQIHFNCIVGLSHLIRG